MSKIDNPKVFISYAWTSDEYTEKVVNLANRLIHDGVEVLLDKFEMSPGKELNDYMEKSVKDSSLTNVLLLLNPTYAERADGRKGGVGTETQIISSEIYNDVGQTKFIPIIFDTAGTSFDKCKPIFVKGRIHLDLSDPNSFENSYMNLVKYLYGMPMYLKPIRGKKPNWVDEIQSTTEIGNRFKTSTMFNSETVSERTLSDSLLEIISKLRTEPIINNNNSWITPESIFKSISGLIKYRNDFLETLNATYDVKNAIDYFVDFFQSLKEFGGSLRLKSDGSSDFIDYFLHEVFIYIIAYYLKRQKFSSIYDLTNRSFINYRYSSPDEVPISFASFFYSSNKIERGMTEFLSKRDGKRYLSGVAQFWSANIYEPMFNVGQFVDADILLSNLSLMSISGVYDWAWFAVSYVYGPNNFTSIIRKIAIAFKSKSLGKRYYPLFGCETVDDAKAVVDKINSFDKTKNYWFGYQGTHETIDLLSKYITIDKVGSVE